MIDRINAIRVNRGLPPLRENQQLAIAAAKHSGDMASSPWLIDSGRYHEGSDGSSIGDRIRREGYRATRWLEVVGWGFQGDSDRMLEWWMNSPVHRDTILSTDVDEMGAGYLYAPGSPWASYWVVDFGRRANAPQPEPPRPHTVNVPIVTTPGAAELDLLPYLRGDGRAYMVQHPSGASEKFRTVTEPNSRFKQLKNSQWEQFYYTPDYIWRDVDTSPGDGQYYRQFEDDAQGARWCPRRMTVGQSWRSPVSHTVQTYDKATCRPVEHHRNGRATNALTLAAHHRQMTWNDITVMDVIELVTHTGEHMFFGRGWGLVAWESTWGSSAIAHVLPPHEADNHPETGCFS